MLAWSEKPSTTYDTISGSMHLALLLIWSVIQQQTEGLMNLLLSDNNNNTDVLS